MRKTKLCKIISIISAFAVILGSLGLTGAVLTSADASDGLELQSIVDENNVAVTNDTTADTLLDSLQALTLDGYEIKAITDFYKIKAIEGAIEKGSTYEGAVDGEILVPGEKGYISAVVELTGPDGEESAVITLTIEPTMAEYSFSSVSTEADFVYNSASWADRWEYQPQSGKAAEKVIIPDKVTELKSDWNQYWSYGVKDTVRCVVFNGNLTAIPGVTGNSWNALEVVSFKGNNLKSLDSYTSGGGTTYGAFYNAGKLKHIRLPDSVTTLGAYTFYKCKSLTTLYLPEGLETIGEKVFFDGNADWNGQGHNLGEITIPASVKSIGRTAFAGALSDFTATVLTSSAEVDEYAFAVWYGGAYNARTTLRALSGTSAASPTTLAGNGTNHPLKALKLLEDDMTVAEAAARAKQKADKINGHKFVDADSILSAITTAYGNVSTLKAEWKSEKWTENANRLENIILITKGNITAEIKISMLNGNFDLMPYLTDIEASNSTTKESLLESLKKISLSDGYSVADITDFYKIKAIQGAIEKGSTYEGAVDGEILVPGEKGYISAVVKLSGPDGEESTVITLTIEPTMAEYSFKSVSTEADFVYNSAWWADRWEYQPQSGTAAEKVIIPDKVTELKTDWCYEERNGIKCLVFNENLTSLPGTTGSDWWQALEVVSFKGNNLKVLDSYTSDGGTTYGTFHNAGKLKHIRLPDSLTTLGAYTFYKCKSLTLLYLPEGLETIGEKVFFDGHAEWEGQGHNLSEITIPSGVKSIGRTAFAGALSDFDVIVLTSSAEVDEYAFSVWYGSAYNPHITLRALTGTSAANPTVNPAEEQYRLKALKLLENDMSIAEAAARVKQKADKINGQKFEDADSILSAVTTAYGNVSTVKTEWKSEEWTEKANRMENTLLITKGDITTEIELSMLTGNYDLTPYIGDIKVSNSTTKESFSESLQNISLPDGYSVLSVDEFYILKAIDGAVDVSTAYNVAKEDKVILSGYNGYLSAVVSLNSPNGVEKTSVVLSFEPEMVEYTFESCSKESEFTVDSDGKLISYNGEAEKIIVPEGVKTIAWDAFSSVKKTMRAVILPESLTSLSTALQGAYKLDVVYMGDNVTTVSGNAFESCYSLKNIRLSESLTALSDAMFRYAYNLFEIHIPDSVTEIKQNAFIRSGLRDVVLSENVETVGDWAFCWMFKDIGSAESSPIDASVKNDVYKYIDDNKVSSVPCTIVVLNPETQFGEGNFGGNSYFTQIIVKAAENSAAYEKAPSAQRINLDAVTITEAAARVQQRADKVNGITVVGTDEFKGILTASYGKASGITAEWKNRFWQQNGKLWENTLVLTKDDKNAEIKVSADIKAQDVQSALDNCKLELTNETTETEFVKLVDGVLPGGYTVDAVTQFFKVNAIDGAVDITDGAKESLVPGHNGSVAAVLEIIGPDSKIITATVVKSIEAKLAEFTFASVSSETDFEIDENGKLVKYSGNAEKVVIPEGVISLGENWLSGIESKKDDYNAEDNAIRCIVYPESLTGTVPNQSNLKALEVVSFKGDEVTELGEYAFFKAVNLKYVDLPANLKIISKGALASGPNSTDIKLTSIYLPEGLTTIGDYAFYWHEVGNNGTVNWDNRARQGLIEIVIPESVTSIGKNAFCYPQITDERSVFTVTLLNAETVCDSAFGYEDSGAGIVIRASKSSDAYSDYKNSDTDYYSLFDLDEMTLAEAAARACVRIDELQNGYYSSDITPEDVTEQIISAYGSYNKFNCDWGTTWDSSIDGKRSGVFTLAEEAYSFDLAVSLDVNPDYDLNDLVEAVKTSVAENEFTNSVTQSGLKAVIDGDMPGGYKVEINEFALRKAIDGAEDDTGVLVSGFNGSVAAIVKVTDYYGNTADVAVESEVVPILEKYTFESVSKKEDFLLSEDGKALVEYYGTAEKIIIPEGVETINVDWMWGDPTCVKALVLPESLKALPKNLCEAMYSLEVVSMYDNVVTVGENTFSECYSLRYIHLSENLEEISANMFSYTYSLFGLRIPESVSYIGNSAFLRSSLRDITVSANVEEVSEYAVTFIAKEAGNLGSNYFPIDESLKAEIFDWVDSNSRDENGILPCTVTFLSADTKVHETNFSSGDQIYAKIIVRTAKESDAYKIAENRINNDSYADTKWQLEALDMPLTEAIARANVAADALILYNGDTEQYIKNYIANSYVSSAVNADAVWSKALKITEADSDTVGKALGTLQISDVSGKFIFDIDIDSVVLAERPKGLAGDGLGDFWGDDPWDDDLWDDDSLDDEEFSDDEDLSDEENDFDDEDFSDEEDNSDNEEDLDDEEDDLVEDSWNDDFSDDDILDEEPSQEENDEPKDENTESEEDIDEQVSSNNESGKFPWIWVIIGAGAVVLLAAGGTICFIFVKKKKKDSK